MTVSPPLNPIMMLLEGNGSLAGRDRSGIFSATGSGALRYAAAPGARVNYAINSRFVNGTTGWTNNGSGSTRTLIADSRFDGGNAMRVVASDTTVSNGFSQLAAVVPICKDGSQTQATLSFDILVESGKYVNLLAGLSGIDANNAFISSAGGGEWFSLSARNVVERKSVTINFGVNHLLSSKFIFYVTNGSLEATTFLISNIVVEYGSVPNATYFDGSMGGAFLDPRTGQLGTAHASPSVERAQFWVEEATTNLFSNPSAESDPISGTWAEHGLGAVLTRDTTAAYLGAASGKVVCDGTAAVQGARVTIGAQTAAIGTIYTGSVMVRAPLGKAMNFRVREEFGNATVVPFIGTGAWQKVSVSHALTIANPTSMHIRVDNTDSPSTAYTFWMDCAQLEQKAYATSYCDGSIGTGYTWAGTAHASASTRALTTVGMPPAGKIDGVNGSVALRSTLPGKGSAYPFMAGTGTTPGNSLVGAIRTPFTANGTLIGYFRDAGVNSVPASTVVGVVGQMMDAYVEWSASFVGISVDSESLVSVVRNGVPGTVDNAMWIGGASGNSINGYVGPVAIYDEPLSDARRTMVNDAIDSNGDTDLWTLFEEWEVIGTELDLNLIGEPGEATAGVASIGAPLELLALQSGASTAGTISEGIPLDLDLAGESGNIIGIDGPTIPIVRRQTGSIA